MNVKKCAKALRVLPVASVAAWRQRGYFQAEMTIEMSYFTETGVIK